MTKTTLVSGATGFVGSHLVRHLVERGAPVRALARASSRRDLLAGLPVEFVTGDLRDRESLDRACRNVGCVFHVAADYRLWAADPSELYQSNVAGTRNLIEAARRAGVERFVYTSTVATIAVPRPGPLPSEATQARLDEMIGHYKRSKFLAEQEALRAAQGGFPVVIVNPTTPVGPGDAKPTPTGRIIVDFLRGRMPAYVDTGLNLVAVEDVAAGHLLAAERGKPGERYILGQRNMTLKQILDLLAGITGRQAPRVRLPHAVAYMAGLADTIVARVRGREPQIPLDGVRMSRHKMFVDCSRAVRELGFAPGAVEAALERAVGWYRERGYGIALGGLAA
ncbi:MAG TPA: hopanoid-associated sugar epimerase [Patescibacteria group bacterium]|nr:hopanoid-associated sugar epimerase [Patescibacteria group bacterium]